MPCASELMTFKNEVLNFNEAKYFFRGFSLKVKLYKWTKMKISTFEFNGI